MAVMFVPAMLSLARIPFSPGSAEDRSSLSIVQSNTNPTLCGKSSSFPFGPRRSRGLPVLVYVVSQRARVLRLRRTNCSLAIIAKQSCCLPPIRRESAS
jgi:hypothetical protein